MLFAIKKYPNPKFYQFQVQLHPSIVVYAS